MDRVGQPTIRAVGWFRLNQPETWDARPRPDDFTYNQARQLGEILEYER